MRLLAKILFAIVPLLLGATTHAQQKGEPGKFDFYLLNVVPASEFCNIKDVGPHCAIPLRPFVLHGLWAQNNNGTYPVFCADNSGPARPGPAHPEHNLDLTPDLVLLDHEWKKHGTCTTLAPDRFFAAERKAFHSFAVPQELTHLEHETELAPADVLRLFTRSNPGFPPGSIILWCSAGRLTSVSACLSKDLKPIACQGIVSCPDKIVRIALASAAVR